MQFNSLESVRKLHIACLICGWAAGSFFRIELLFSFILHTFLLYLGKGENQINGGDLHKKFKICTQPDEIINCTLVTNRLQRYVQEINYLNDELI